ncbi:unnamed protein product, partial [Cylicocyclus nassatus]
DTNARNFFGDIKSCKKTCGHKYPVTPDSLRPHYYVTPTKIHTRKMETYHNFSEPVDSQPTTPLNTSTTNISTKANTSPVTEKAKGTATIKIKITTKPETTTTQTMTFTDAPSQRSITDFERKVDTAPKLTPVSTMKTAETNETESPISKSPPFPLTTSELTD